MEPEPWEALDIEEEEAEDSLLHLPCKRKSTFSTSAPNSDTFLLRPCSLNSVISGPAGAVQVAMHRKSLMVVGVEEEPIPTQEYIRRAVEEPCFRNDDDFSRDPWLFAVDFVRREGLVGSDGVAIGTPLSYIKTGFNLDKVSQIVAIIKSSFPNGLGDLMVTLKDPTGTIDASIHHKVLTEAEFSKDISVGAVLVLKKVAVFSPSRSTHYLNITLGNIIKVISKDCGNLSDHNYPALMIKQASTVESSEKSWKLPKTVSQSQVTTEGILNCLRQKANLRRNEQNGKQQDEENASVSRSFCADGDSKGERSAQEKDSLVVSLDVEDARKETSMNTGTSDNEQGSLFGKEASQLNQATTSNLSGEFQGRNIAENHVDTPKNDENENADGVKKHRQLLTSKGSLPEWTDEQLDELLSFD